MTRVAINLASQPFRRDRPILVASATVGLMLVGLLALLISLALAEHRQMADTRREVAGLERQLQSLAREQARLEAVLRQPENAEVLERSLFLNTLLYRKGISWTRIFSDLEKIVPHNVRVVSIQPQVYEQNRIFLNMILGSESTEPVVDLLMRLEGSESFGATYVHSYLPPSQSEPLFRYRVSVSYGQKF
jgi:type IV pilus assembly protein PilN